MAKATKAEANYRRGSKAKRCAQCSMFRPPDDCTAVKKGEDGISPGGLCDYFERKNARGERWYGGGNG